MLELWRKMPKLPEIVIPVEHAEEKTRVLRVLEIPPVGVDRSPE
jgi:hypothetical protein